MASKVHFLKRPFPTTESAQQDLWLAFSFGAFVFVFLQFFKPFGIDNINSHVVLITWAFGAITTTCILFMQFVPKQIFRDSYLPEKWTLGKDIAHTSTIVLLVSICNFLFASALHFFPFRWGTFLTFLVFTLAVGAFPISIATLIRQSILYRRYYKQSQELNETKPRTEEQRADQKIELQNEESKTELTIQINELLAIQSADNYVVVFYEEQGELRKSMFRNTLKNLESALEQNKEVYRCHRSYLVNLHRVQKVSGNARGYYLEMTDSLSIPVSRRKKDEFLSVWENLHK